MPLILKRNLKLPGGFIGNVNAVSEVAAVSYARRSITEREIDQVGHFKWL